MSHYLASEQETLQFGRLIAKHCQQGMLMFLHGNLGAGKTTLVRGLIDGLGYQGKVKSPTYTLVESYPLPQSQGEIQQVFHFDLYRLADPEELEYLGGRDYFSADALCLVEWPEKGEGWLAQPDLEISLIYQNDGRDLSMQANTARGDKLLRAVTDDLVKK